VRASPPIFARQSFFTALFLVSPPTV